MRIYLSCLACDQEWWQDSKIVPDPCPKCRCSDSVYQPMRDCPTCAGHGKITIGQPANTDATCTVCGRNLAEHRLAYRTFRIGDRYACVECLPPTHNENAPYLDYDTSERSREA